MAVMRTGRLLLFGHVERMGNNNCMKHIKYIEMEGSVGRKTESDRMRL